jgi:CDP-paratose synthetase
MKILVSGTTGFVGQHLVKRLAENGHEIFPLAHPTNDFSFLEREKFDGVIHLASLFLAQHKSEDTVGLVDSNILLGTNLLEVSVKNNIPWFINTGTFWQHYEDKEYSPVNLYSATKQAFQDIAQYYIETSEIDFVTIKLIDTFGPNDTRPKLFNLWDKISRSGETLDMSAGEQIMDISFIDNVIDAYVQMIELISKDKERKLNGKSFAVTSGERMTLKELAKLFEKTTGKKLNINWGQRSYRPREVMVPWTKGETIPGWKQKVSIEEGIRKTFNF